MDGRVVINDRSRRALVVVIALAALALALAAAPARAVNLYKTINHSFKAPFDLPFAGVQGLAPSPEGAYIYVGSGGKVIQYTDAGVWVRTWSPAFGDVGGVATDPSGDVFVVDRANGQVQRFDKNEKHLGTWSVPGVQQIAADAQGHLFLLVSVLLGWVVDVRSYAGVDEGAWSAVLPDSFRTIAYTPGTTKSINTIAADPAGDVFLGGISSQRLEGEGQDCHQLRPQDQYEYWDPLESGEVTRYSRSGTVTGWGWLNTSTRSSCYPPFISQGYPLALAVAPDNGNVWVDDYSSFFRDMATQGSSFSVTESLEEPCMACNNPPSPNLPFEGPATFDCHGNLFVGAGAAVLEFIAIPEAKACPSRLSQLARLTLAPVLRIAAKKVKTKKSKTLAFEAGCTGPGCSISVLAQARRPHCHRGNCLIVLAHGRFNLKAGAHTLTLTLTHADEALLGRDPRLPIQLSARLLRHGHPFGQTFHAGGGQPLLALPAVQMSLSCPSQASLGSQISLSGTLGLPGAHTLSMAIRSPSGHFSQQLQSTSGGAFALSLAASAAGAWTFAATYAGDHLHAPSGAGCATIVPIPPPPPSHKKGPPPPPVATTLELACRKGGKGPFTGKLSPALAEAPITITYEFKADPASQLVKLVDQVKTNTEGTFSDTPEPEISVDAKGTATASWPGKPGYTSATSPSCGFEP